MDFGFSRVKRLTSPVKERGGRGKGDGDDFRRTFLRDWEKKSKNDKEEPPRPSPHGKTDLLLRFFDSVFFNEWIAIT